MHSEDISLILGWQVILNEFQEVCLLVVKITVWYQVRVTTTECMVVFVDDIDVVEIVQDSLDCSSIVDICYSSTIVGFSSHVSEGIEWNAFVVIKELFKL